MTGQIHSVSSKRTDPRANDNSAVPILLVDDNAGKRLSLKAILSPLGYRVVEAESGADALRALIHEDFAVILMDVRMPIMDGFETAGYIRQRVQSELTPIIFITAQDKAEATNLKAYDLGAADFITSPINPAELRAKVSVFANLYLRAEQLSERGRELQESANQLTLLTEAAPIGIFRIDADDNYLYTNPSWTEITGIAFADAVGRPLDFVMSPQTRSPIRAAPPGNAGSDSTWSHRFEVDQPADTPPRIVQLTAKPLVGQDDARLGWVGTIADVTADAAAQAAMVAAKDVAEATVLMQNNFAASASHELKTPTASILGFIEEVLDNEHLSEADRRTLDIVYRNAQRLSQLIDDLLVLGTADIDPLVMHAEPMELVPLVQGLVSAFSAIASAVDVDLAFDPVPDPGVESPVAFADPQRLEQSLTNLISNALKFTPPGGRISIGISCLAEGGSVQLTVRDTGMGIEPSAIANIFDRFYRADSVMRTDIKGSGLGLAIAQRMIAAQNGQLCVTSVVGKGSVFTVTLPAARRVANL